MFQMSAALIVCGFVYEIVVLSCGVHLGAWDLFSRFTPENLERLEPLIFLGLCTLYTITTFVSALQIAAWRRFKMLMQMPFSIGMVADTVIFSWIVQSTVMLLFVTCPLAAAWLGQGRFLARDLATLVVFFVIENVEAVCIGITVGSTLFGIAVTSGRRKYFIVRLTLAGSLATLGLTAVAAQLKSLALLPPLPFPGGFESLRGAVTARAFAHHALAIAGLYMLARIAVRDCLLTQWEILSSVLLGSGRLTLLNRIWMISTLPFKGPVRALMVREFHVLTRDAQTGVILAVVAGTSVAAGAGSVIFFSQEVTTVSILESLSKGALIAGFLLAIISWTTTFFLSSSSVGGECDDMEMIAAQPIQPWHLLAAKTWVHGLFLAVPTVLALGAGVWVAHEVRETQKAIPWLGLVLGIPVCLIPPFFLVWISICTGAILPDPRATNRYTAVTSMGWGVICVLWLLCIGSFVGCVLTMRWLTNPVYSLPLVLTALWALVGVLLHREAVRAMSESGWAKPTD